MERYPVNSSYLSEVGYDNYNHILEIKFKPNSVVFQYYDVSPQTFHDLINSKSLGKYFHKYIKHNYLEKRII